MFAETKITQFHPDGVVVPLRPELPLEEDHRSPRNQYSGDSAILNTYIKEISQFKVLTPVEERELFQKIDLHRELVELHSQYLKEYPNPDDTAVIQESLDITRQDLNALIKEAVEHNLKLVVPIAVRTARFYRKLSLNDLIQAGNIGIFAAIEKFDYRKDFKFSTFATWHITGEIQKFKAEMTSPFSLSVGALKRKKAFQEEKDRLWSKSGEKPSFVKVGDYLGLSEEISLETSRILKSHISLTAPLDSDSNTVDVIGDLVPDSEAENTETKGIEMAAVADLACLLRELKVQNYLSEDELIVTSQRVGMNNAGIVLTLDKIGKHIGKTRERARQIETRGFRKLREFAPDTTQKNLSPEVVEEIQRILTKIHSYRGC
ncbi:MAG: sigma-70 family RNA polymerase sigma factor [Patescibacteria group bacterium]|nr:sigma-70 family RNA polymerase sigma factor [Patescibacteria group bacterium]